MESRGAGFWRRHCWDRTWRVASAAPATGHGNGGWMAIVRSLFGIRDGGLLAERQVVREVFGVAGDLPPLVPEVVRDRGAKAGIGDEKGRVGGGGGGAG